MTKYEPLTKQSDRKHVESLMLQRLPTTNIGNAAFAGFNSILADLAHAEACLAEREAEIERLNEVYHAAKGLCYGEDWNNGTHAKLHGCRQRLINAVNAIELPPAPAMQPETKGE